MTILLLLLTIVPQQPQTVYLQDTVCFFELNTVPRWNYQTLQWEPGMQAYLFWDALPYPRIVAWRYRDGMEILDEGPHFVEFVDVYPSNGDRRVIRRVRFLKSWNSVTCKDKEVQNRYVWPTKRRRGLSEVP